MIAKTKKILNNIGIGELFIIVLVLSYILLVIFMMPKGGIGHGGNLFEPNDQDGTTLMDVDTGMDFFNSVQYTKGGDPYFSYGTLYPPLANLYFYGMYNLMPVGVREMIPDTFTDILFQRASYVDIRVHQSGLFLFIMFVVITMILLFCMIQRILKDVEHTNLIALGCCFSIVVVFSLERGNIILLALLFTLFFLKFHEDPNPVYRELSYIALAIAAGLKLYPALFGVLLIGEKKIWPGIRTVIYGMAAFFLPFFAFGGIPALFKFISIFRKFSSGGSVYLSGYGVRNVVKVILYIIKCISENIAFGTAVSLDEYSGVLRTAQLASYVLMIVFLGFALIEKRYWNKLLLIGLAIVSGQDSDVYTGVFLLIPLIFLFAEEHSFNRNMLVEYILLTIMMIPIPLTLYSVTLAGKPKYTFVKTVHQVIYTLLVIWVIVKQLKDVRKNLKSN